jgi:ribosomal protein L37AE/L43A
MLACFITPKRSSFLGIGSIMISIDPQRSTRKDVFNQPSKHRCPECQAFMTEVQRVAENGLLFIWYECSRDACDGQWLESKKIRMGIV